MRTRLLTLAGLLIGLVVLPVAAFGARNASGTYSLPAGNPVVTGTTISSTWANNTLSDLKTEMTDSLSRSGKGAMLAPLQLSNGTSGAPSLTFGSETTTGWYRAGAADVRLYIAGVLAEKYTSTALTYSLPLTCTNGFIVTQSGSNQTAIAATGNGTGNGVEGYGGATSGTGVFGTGGLTNGKGVVGVGLGTGNGGYFTGGSNAGVGGYFTGGGAAGGAGISAGNGVAATGGTRKDAITVRNGDIDMSGVTNPTSTTALQNRLTPLNIVKAFGTLTYGASPTLNGGFNVASLSCGTSVVTVTLAQAMANTSYTVIVNTRLAGRFAHVVVTSTTQFAIYQYSQGGAQNDLCTGADTIDFIVLGAQ